MTKWIVLELQGETGGSLLDWLQLYGESRAVIITAKLILSSLCKEGYKNEGAKLPKEFNIVRQSQL